MKAIDFPELGSDVQVRFLNPDLRKLQEQFGELWFVEAAERFDRADLNWIAACLQHGGKVTTGAARPIKLEEIVSLPMSEVVKRVQDAFYYQTNGCTYEEFVLKKIADNSAAKDKIRELLDGAA